MVGNLTRRSFLKLSVGVVAVSILPVAGWGQTSSIAGQAQQRIDGFAKVTGQKVYARDFSAADMCWQGQQWYALFARALTTGQVFEHLDLSSLPESAAPAKLVYGDELHTTARAAMQFQDAKFQVYGAAVPPPPALVFDPTTWFVRYDQRGENFSYAQDGSKVYDTNAPFFAAQIGSYLATTSD